jgi:pyruvate formate lyase activating enzyme
VCENGAHTFEDGQHRYDRSLCERCGKCIDTCVFGALTAAGEQLSASEVMDLVMRDQAYYRKSGGGLTLSGGEPLLQARFTQALLRSARASGLHTCVETCGETSQAAFEMILPLVDLFLYDIKATDPKRHKTLTRVDNHRILANLDFLYHQGAEIRLRCPLIPGVNDSSEDLKGIAVLAGRYPRMQGVEIMPYHNLGHQKYQRFGYPDLLSDLPAADAETKQGWIKSLQRFGCPRVTLD